MKKPKAVSLTEAEKRELRSKRKLEIEEQRAAKKREVFLAFNMLLCSLNM